MSDDPHDQLLLQIRAAVAEYERTLIAERMRRGRQAKLRSGQLLPWTRAPYGYLLDAERPRDPSRVRLDPVQAAVVEQMFAWYGDPSQPVSLYEVAKRLSETQLPTPRGGKRWNVASVRGILRSPVYKKWKSMTPAMAAGLTDHVWTMDELLSFRVPPQSLWS
jgi:site-specific DNA recombinase